MKHISVEPLQTKPDLTMKQFIAWREGFREEPSDKLCISAYTTTQAKRLATKELKVSKGTWSRMDIKIGSITVYGYNKGCSGWAYGDNPRIYMYEKEEYERKQKLQNKSN